MRHLIPWLLSFLRDYGIANGRVVDLGCGDGQWLAALGEADYATAGIELSPELAAIARRAAPSARIEVGSVHDLPIPNCDAVTAIGEVLGYLPPDQPRPDLAATLRRIAAALRPRGWLIFDLYVGGANFRGGVRHWRAAADWAVLSETRDDAEGGTATRRVVTFRAEPDGRYRRGGETHRLAVHSADEVLRMLRAAGFAAEATGAYGERALAPGRMAFFAQRR